MTKKEYFRNWRIKNREKNNAYKKEWARKWRLRQGMKPISRFVPYKLKVPKDDYCNLDKCFRLKRARGCCQSHYNALIAKKNYLFFEPIIPPEERWKLWKNKNRVKIKNYKDYLKEEKERNEKSIKRD